MITVLHVNNLRIIDAPPSEDFIDSNYAEVAIVDTEDLEVAFEKTNSITTNWWSNEDVDAVFKDSCCRSTSAGDILILEGRYFIVASFGFNELTFGE